MAPINAIRQTMLKERLLGDVSGTTILEMDQQLGSGVNPYVDYFAEHDIPFDGIDEVGMGEKTPYDFM